MQHARIGEAEAEFERLFGVSHVKSALSELIRSDRGDDADGVKFLELLYGRHFRGMHIMHKSLSAALSASC